METSERFRNYARESNRWYRNFYTNTKVHKMAKDSKLHTFDWKLPTTLMLGRYQPWHGGHRALFKAGLKKTGQVLILVRDTHEKESKTDPLPYFQVRQRINEDLHDEFKGRYRVRQCPNITNIVYGRDVGYKIEKVRLSKEIEKISGTKIRKKMNEKP